MGWDKYFVDLQGCQFQKKGYHQLRNESQKCGAEKQAHLLLNPVAEIEVSPPCIRT